MRRRSRWRAAAALVLAFAMLMPQTVFAKDMDHPTASTVSYYTENGKKTGVESFSISPFTYYNIGRDADINPGKGDTLVLNTARLKDIAAKEIFPRWSIIAEGIFRDKADQLVTIEGSGLMSSDKTAANSFDRQFNFRKKDVNQGYSGYDWSIGDFAEMLSRTTARHDGETCWDEMRATGITAIGSLADARRLMGQELRNCSDDDDVSVDDFLGNKKDKNSNEYRLPDLDNSKSGSGFASIVTCVNRSGSSGDYDYVSFGLAVYDFDVSPIAANDLEYITAADKTADGKAMVDGKKGNIPWKNAVGISYNEAADKPSEKQFINDSTAEAEAESGIENSTTIENTLTTEESFEWGMTQHVGAQINVGGASDSFPTVTVEVSNEWSEVWSTMNGKSESKGESKTKSASQTISMPPHTAVTLKENSAVTTVKERYQQPVVINYKVAIFAMSGDYFNGWWGEISNDRYDKQWMSVIFDGSDQQEKPGNNAIGSLYNRAIANRSVQGYDGSTGKLRSWCDKGAWRKSGNIKWADIEDELTDSNENRDSHNITSRRTGKKSTLSDLATELPIIEQSVIMNTNKEVMTSDLTQKVPLYNLDSVDVKDKTKKRYQMNAGDVLYLDGVEMEGYDEDGVEFYGFDPSWGSWQMLDQSGKPVADSDGDGRVSSGNFTLVTDENLDIQYVEAEENQTQSLSSVNLKWVVDEDAKISSNKILTDYNNNRRSTGIMTAKELAKIKVPQIQIFMKKNPVSRVQVSGSYEGLVNEQVNLNKVLDVSALAEMDGSDEAAESAQVPVYWEAKDDSGINVKESGDCSIDRAGEYQVRAYCLESGEVAAQELSADASANRNYSEWVTIKAKDAPVLSSVKFDTAKLEELSRTLKIDTEHPVVKVDLNEYLLYFDQYGEPMAPYSYDESEQTWSQLVSEVLYDLDSGDNAHIQYPGLLIVSKPGSFTVSARAHDQNDEDKYYNIAPAQIKVGGEQYLSAIEFDDAAFAEYQGLELSGVGDEIVIRDLKNKIRFCDKYGDPWTGEKPEVVFSYEYGDAPNKDYEVVDNNEFHIRKPGTINLWLNSGDFVDHVEIDIRDGTNMEDMDNLVISLTDPGDIILDGSGTETDLDIERFVEYKTLLGGKWEGIIPELSFELDQAGSGAKLESRTEVISKKDEELRTREYTSFVTKTPGSYTIHVAAKNAAQYSGKIGDLVLRVKGTSKLNIKTKSVRIKRGKSAKIKYSSTPKGAAVKFKNKSSKAVKKVIKLSSNGRIKVSKKAKKGKTYKVKVMATYAGNSKYTSARTAVKTIKVKVK